MIDASSSLASGLLSGYFGTPAASSPGTAASAGDSGTDSAATPAYILDGSLGALGSGGALGSFLSNAIFAEDTQALLLDPLSNGAITGTPSAYVQKILSQLDPAINKAATGDSATTTAATGAVSTPDNATASTDTTATTVSGLPTDGVLA